MKNLILVNFFSIILLLLCRIRSTFQFECPEGYILHSLCESGVMHEDLFSPECLALPNICIPDSCPEGYDTTYKPHLLGYHVHFDSFSGELPCSKLVEHACEPGLYRLGTRPCEAELGWREVISGRSGTRFCAECVAEPCPCTSSTQTKSCPRGYNLVTESDVETGTQEVLSGGVPCQKCVALQCPKNTHQCKEACGKGYSAVDSGYVYGVENSNGFGGARKCYKCAPAKCPPKSEPLKSEVLDFVIVEKAAEGFNVQITGHSGTEICVRFVKTECAPSFHVLHDFCDKDKGWHIVELGKSGDLPCRKCIPKECPRDYAPGVTCTGVGYERLVSGYSGGRLCVKCEEKPCPAGWVPLGVENSKIGDSDLNDLIVQTLTSCEVEKGWYLEQSGTYFSGSCPCVRCSERKCPQKSWPYKEIPPVECDPGYEYAAVTGHYSGGKPCIACKPTPCPQSKKRVSEDVGEGLEWTTEDLFCDETAGWILEVGPLSGEELCKRCVPVKPCEPPFEFGLVDCNWTENSRGYALKSFWSGGRVCSTCEKLQCTQPFDNSADNPECGIGYDLLLGGWSGSERCYHCRERNCAEGYFKRSTLGTMGTRGEYEFETNGMSGDEDCVKVVPKKCPEGSSTKLVQCNRGYTLEAVARSGLEDCNQCFVKDCPYGSHLESEVTCSGPGWKVVSRGMSGDISCIECVEKVCPEGYGLKDRIPECNAPKPVRRIIGSVCDSKEGWEEVAGGHSGDDVCKCCKRLRCPPRSSVNPPLKCTEREGWDLVVRGKSEGEECLECVARPCPEDTSRRDDLDGAAARGYDFRELEVDGHVVKSGGVDCGRFEARDCPVDCSKDVDDVKCLEVEGWRWKSCGYAGLDECRKCYPMSCPVGFYPQPDTENWCDESGGCYKLHKHENVRSGGRACVWCEKIGCPEGYSVDVSEVKCLEKNNLGYELLSKGECDGKLCRKCSEIPCPFFGKKKDGTDVYYVKKTLLLQQNPCNNENQILTCEMTGVKYYSGEEECCICTEGVISSEI